jgi:hypothetical protein
MSVIKFERCDCAGPNPHGYFYKDGMILEVLILSVTAGKRLLERTSNDLNDQDKSRLEQEMVNAGLPEKKADDEDILAVDESLKILYTIATMMTDTTENDEDVQHGIMLLIALGEQPSSD